MQRFTENLTRVLSYILIGLMASIVVDVTWQVFTRFVLKNPSSFTEELAGFLLIWIGLLGASYTYYKKAHLGIDCFTASVTGVKKIVAEITVAVVVLLFALSVLVIGGMHLVTITFTLRQISPSMKIPMGYVYLVLPLTGVLFMYYSVVSIVETVKRREESVPESR